MRVRLPWQKTDAKQLDLLDAEAAAPTAAHSKPFGVALPTPADSLPSAAAQSGQPLMVAASLLDEDAHNPRTEFLDAEVDDLAENLRENGILQPLVVHPADAEGRYRVHFGAMRLRAARRAGLGELPVVIRAAPADPYAQVAENLKRHNLAPLDLARFFKGRIDAGDTNAAVAKRLNVNLTTVAHHLALLNLPPELDQALKSGRCTSPRTLHELSRLHEQQPEQVKALVDRPGDITREAVATLRERVESRAASPSTRLIAQAIAACDRLGKLLDRIEPVAPDAGSADLAILRAKVTALSEWSPRGSDGQTP